MFACSYNHITNMLWKNISEFYPFIWKQSAVNQMTFALRTVLCIAFPKYFFEQNIWICEFSRNKSLEKEISFVILIIILFHRVSFNKAVSTYYGKGWSLLWRHNGHDGVSNHQPHDCLLNRLFRRRSKKTSKLRVTGLCAGDRWIPRTNGQ